MDSVTMSDGPVYARGGWSRANGYPAGMSDALVARLARIELEEQRQAAIEQQALDVLREDWHTRSAQAAALMAEQRGEVFSARDALRGWVGRTKAEALAYLSAQADLEDAQQMARLRREFRHWPDDAIHAEMSADTTPPTPEELAQAAASRESARVAERERQRQRRKDHAAAERARVVAREEILLHEWGVS